MNVPRRPMTATDVQRAAIALIVLLLADLVAVTVLPRPIRLKAPDELADVVPELQRFVEQARGRRFYKQVKIRRSDDLGNVHTGLNQIDAGQPPAGDAAADQAALLRALGLTDQRYDPQAVRQTISNSVLGVYNPAKHELVVRPGPVTPRLRVTLVHELTHALDGEHHELRWSERRRGLVPDEAATSFRALAEGTAVYVEAKYVESLSAEDKAAATAQQPPPPDAQPQGIDPLRALAAYPYTAGRTFVESLVQRDGLDAVDRAFGDPPITSEQVLNIDKYINDDEPKYVVKPLPQTNNVVGRGVFSELLLRLLVARNSGVDAARDVGAGWGGGRYAAWRTATEVCVAVHLVMDTGPDTEELLAALGRWAEGKPRAKVSAGPPVAFENCVPR